MSIIYNNTNIDNINYNNIELDKVIYNNIVVYEKGISIDDIKLNDTIDVELTGTFPTTTKTYTYPFKCVYVKGNTKYLLCQKQMYRQYWKEACEASWSTNSFNTTITNIKIPDKTFIDDINANDRVINDSSYSQYYWTSYTESSEENGYAIAIPVNGGTVSCAKKSYCAVVPVIIFN